MTCANITMTNILDLKCFLINELAGSVMIFYIICYMAIIWFLGKNRAPGIITVLALAIFTGIMQAFLPMPRLWWAFLLIAALFIYLAINRFINRG